ncbi:MAG: ribulose-phosphate 3-epimerase [Acidobacteria bacterium]|nr:ribulose-phosphate 3-epimerase [Acidobacteriota bacterium]
MTAQVLPSLLSANFANLEHDIEQVTAAGAQALHFDVMDGRFVPNISIGVPVLRAVRRITRLTLDVHLMIVEPEKYVDAFVDAGADWISFHYEATAHGHRLAQRIRHSGARAGVAINPGTPVSVLEQLLPSVDFVLTMSVNPGFAGQNFIPETLDKLRKLEELKAATHARVLTEIDGGIGPDNVDLVVKYGSDLIVAGSSVFAEDEPARAFQRLQELATAASVNKVVGFQA